MPFLKLNANTCIAVFPKVASCSILTAAYENGAVNITPEEALRLDKRVMFVRHPLERLVSAFSWLMQAHKQGTPACRSVYPSIMGQEVLGTGVNGETKPLIDAWKAFVDHILVADNDHWTPQIELASHNGVLIPNRAFKFEELNDRWGTYSAGRFPSTLPHLHRVTKLTPPDYRVDDLREFYRKDIIARQRL